MKYRDTDYIFGSALIRATENSLLTYDRLCRMINAASDDEAMRVLSECGYTDISGGTDVCIERKRREVLETIEKITPDSETAEFFRIRYYGNNVKVILKGEYSGKPYEDLLTDAGGVEISELVGFAKGEKTGDNLPDWLKECVNSAGGELQKTGDGACADTIIERACFAQMKRTAQNINSKFLIDYTELLIDGINLKTAVRLRLMGKDTVRELSEFFIDGGSADLSGFQPSDDCAGFIKLLRGAELKTAADAALVMKRDADFSEITRAAETAQRNYLLQARSVVFGEQPVIAYAAAREAEFSAIRAVMIFRAAGITADAAAEKLRWRYV